MLVVALVVVGPSRLPEIARSIGRLVGRARRANENFLDLTRDIGRYTRPESEQTAADKIEVKKHQLAPPAPPYTPDPPDTPKKNAIGRQTPDDTSKP